MSAERHKNQAYRQKMSQKERKTSPFFVFNKNFRFLIITCARQKVTLLSKELLYTRSTLSSLPLLCTIEHNTRCHSIDGLLTSRPVCSRSTVVLVPGWYHWVNVISVFHDFFCLALQIYLNIACSVNDCTVGWYVYTRKFWVTPPIFSYWIYTYDDTVSDRQS